MPEAIGLTVENLFPIVRGLGTLTKDAERLVNRAIRPMVKELHSRAESKGRSLGGVHAHTIRAGGVKRFTRAGISGIELSGSVPTAAGSEFGAKQWAQFPEWKGNQFTNPARGKVGYMIHPALREYLPRAEKQIADAVADAVDEALR